MSNNKSIQRLTIIGTGVIGASWMALFLSKGLDVISTDITPDAQTSLRHFVKAAWPARMQCALGSGRFY
jgi:3-hydroxyacyl-CoA dehydrogenase